jgi:3-oxoacyl-[acyl-carrier-protein] synthase-1/3-oxoacyl-[acyl-carrier-protein] synthase II
VASPYASKYPAFCVDESIISQKEDESLSFTFLKTALYEALKDAKLNEQILSEARVGICIGTSVDASFNCFDFYKDWVKNKPTSIAPLNKYMHYSLANQCLKQLNISGIEATITTACASSTDAIGLGALWVASGLCDIAICGGADELNIIPYTGFIKLMAASTEPPKPFDKYRKGINLGEGAGIVVLESCDFLHKRGGLKKGSVLAYAQRADGYHLTAPDPCGAGLRAAIETALAQAKIAKDNIAFINSHATATQDNDKVEAKVFNEILGGVKVCATKGLTGHCLGAAGAIEAVITLISLNESLAPKAKNFSCPDEKLNISPLIENTKINKAQAAISDSLSFGGINSVLVLGGGHYE